MRLAILPFVLSSCAGMEHTVEREATAPTAGTAAVAAIDERAPIRPTFAWAREGEPAPAEVAPMRLTATDGTGLALRSMEVASVVEDPLVFTEIHLAFENPEARVIEGRFEITLPPGAAISRFAMKIGEHWQEGEVLEKQAARRAYEDFLHRRQDPALLEKDSGNVFSARVFPIPANGRKELIVSYSQELRGADEPYQVLLRGLPRLERLDAVLRVRDFDGEPEVYRVSERDFVPDRDLRVVLDGPANVGLRSGDLVVMRVRPELGDGLDPVRGLSVLFDTSASRGLGFEAAVGRLDEALDALVAADRDFPLTVYAFDQTVAPIYRGRASGFGTEQRRALIDRGALGASDLGAALTALGAEPPADRVLLVTDGVVTAGEDDPAALRAIVARLEARGVQRLDVLVDGGLRDAELLAELVTAGLPRDGVVAEATSAGAVVRKLGRTTRSGIEVHVPGAVWVWPDTLNGVQAGDEALIYAEVPADRPVQVALSGVSLGGPVALGPVPRPLLERAAAKARIERLQHQLARTTDAATKAELAHSIVGLSTRHRVLSDLTALLVLETAEDYARYGIARDALGDILSVGETGIEVVDRHPPPPAPGATRFVLATERKNVELDGRDDGEAPDDAPSRQGRSLEDPGASPAPPPEAARSAVQAAAPAEEVEEELSPPPPRPAPAPRPPPWQSADVPMMGVVERSEPEPAAAEVEARPDRGRRDDAAREADPTAGWTGPFREVMVLLRARDVADAVARARAWRATDPGDVLAVVALGEALEAAGDPGGAARAYGSIIDLYPSRADLRRMAGQRLERLGKVGLALAADSYVHAVEQRPDHPSSHRLLAYALVQLGRPQEAFEAIVAGAMRAYPDGRFAGVPRILAEDVGLVGAAWRRAEPLRAREIEGRVRDAGGVAPKGPTMRFVLYWETDANDVDFHIHDGKGGHAWYSQKVLPSGGELYADVTTGYGPECFTIESPRTFPYTLQAHYYSRGPMGYGMGTLQTLTHDGEGGLTFEHRPYVIMVDQAYVALGVVGGR